MLFGFHTLSAGAINCMPPCLSVCLSVYLSTVYLSHVNHRQCSVQDLWRSWCQQAAWRVGELRQPCWTPLQPVWTPGASLVGLQATVPVSQISWWSLGGGTEWLEVQCTSCVIFAIPVKMTTLPIQWILCTMVILWTFLTTACGSVIIESRRSY